MKKEKRVPQENDRVILIGFSYGGKDVDGKKGTYKSRDGAHYGITMDDDCLVLVHRNQIRFITKKKKPVHEIFVNMYHDKSRDIAHSTRDSAIKSACDSAVEKGVRYVRAKNQKIFQ